MKIKPAAIIENKNGKVSSLVGTDAVLCMKYRTILIGLKAEAEGMRLTRGTSCTKMAKQLTGLRTNDRAKLAERVQILLDQQIAKCVVINDGEVE
jgi:hypothetical protein